MSTFVNFLIYATYFGKFGFSFLFLRILVNFLAIQLDLVYSYWQKYFLEIFCNTIKMVALNNFVAKKN